MSNNFLGAKASKTLGMFPRRSKTARPVDQASPKANFKRSLDVYAPADISSFGKGGVIFINDIDDAYRHYMASALLASKFSPAFARRLGELNEFANSQYTESSTQMDYWNNEAGILAGASTDSEFELVIKFVNDAAAGKLRVIDPGAKEVRATEVGDLPHGRTGTPLENRYRPDKSTSPDDMGGSQSGAMPA